jgi:hypothetical protein
MKRKPWKNNAKHKNKQAQKKALQANRSGVCPQQKE